MHNAETAWKMQHLCGEQRLGRCLSDQLVDGNAVSGARTSFQNRIGQRDPRTRTCHVSQVMNSVRVAFADKQRESTIFAKKRAFGPITPSLRTCRKGSGPAITISG